MVQICGYSFEDNQSALILANISRSTKTDDRGTRTQDKILTIKDVILPSPHNFPTIVDIFKKYKWEENVETHLAYCEPLQKQLQIGVEYLHNLYNIDVWQTAEELHKFLISQERLIIDCDLDLSKEFIKKSFYILLSGSLFHLCPKIEYRPQEYQYKPYPHLLKYVNSPNPHPLQPLTHWNGDPLYSIQY